MARSFANRLLAFASFAMAFCASPLPAQDDIASLRAEIERQREIIEQQQQRLTEQAERLAEMLARLEALEVEEQSAAAEAQRAAEGIGTEPVRERFVRDSVGDLNAPAVRAGDFPGSILLPGQGVAIAVGGFAKALAFYDSDSESQGEFVLPGLLGVASPDQAGDFVVSGRLSRINLDARTRLGGPQARGYVEVDFVAPTNFNLRHAYAALATSKGELRAGQYWSTFMDVAALPEAAGEPTISGTMFVRQGQISWQQQLASGLQYGVAIESPGSSDVFAPEGFRRHTSRPDVIATLTRSVAETGHLRLAGMVRRIGLIGPTGDKIAATGWGVQLSGAVNAVGRDRFSFNVATGDGIGRYLLGLERQSGAHLTGDARLSTRSTHGGFAAYRRFWSRSIRSNFMFGAAHATPLAQQPSGTLRRSYYAASNLLFDVSQFAVIGVEYVYGKRFNKDAPGRENHRIQLGLQVF